MRSIDYIVGLHIQFGLTIMHLLDLVAGRTGKNIYLLCLISTLNIFCRFYLLPIVEAIFHVYLNTRNIYLLCLISTLNIFCQFYLLPIVEAIFHVYLNIYLLCLISTLNIFCQFHLLPIVEAIFHVYGLPNGISQFSH